MHISQLHGNGHVIRDGKATVTQTGISTPTSSSTTPPSPPQKSNSFSLDAPTGIALFIAIVLLVTGITLVVRDRCRGKSQTVAPENKTAQTNGSKHMSINAWVRGPGSSRGGEQSVDSAESRTGGAGAS
ncbi:hypothetical protein B0H17DRAFT_1330612 [Mycena rosella]|uniref:Uncharacterized protein n=1 Tax=Mycena rosella TaxID=1033263 RepID=A0AAD7DK27_MYCRO|nr:hypothetical protein B0H17DRAFT_1330612 [Mycena rosella]